MVPEPRIQISSIHLVDVASGRELWRRESHAGGIDGLAFSPDGMTLASAGENVIRFWNVPPGQERRANPGHRSRIVGIAVAPAGKTVVTGGRDRTIRVWDLKTGEEQRWIERSAEPIRFLALSADGTTLASGGEHHPSRIWDMTTEDIWDVTTGKELRQIPFPESRTAFFGDISADGKILATAEGGSELVFWDVAAGNRVTGRALDDTIAGNTSLPYAARKRSAKRKTLAWINPPRINALRFAPDGRSVASISGDWGRIWDVAAAQKTRCIKLPNASDSRIDEMNMVGAQDVYSRDGNLIAASNKRDGRVFLLDASAGKELIRVLASADVVKVFAFSPRGRILATQLSVASVTQKAPVIRLWDVPGRRELGRIEGHRGPVTALAFSPDGSRLISSSEDATALIWDVAALTGRGTAGRSPSPSRKD